MRTINCSNKRILKGSDRVRQLYVEQLMRDLEDLIKLLLNGAQAKGRRNEK